MTFRQLELFTLVCQHQSIARVSELNFVSPQSISRMIKDIENELGTPLFTRSNKGITPTEIGKYFYSESLELLEKKEALIKNIAQMNTTNKERIHIGMAIGTLSALNYHLFDDFKSDNPNIEIEYTEYMDTELEVRFINREFDFCITTSSLDHSAYTNAKLLTEPVYIAIPLQHDLYEKHNITIHDLVPYEFAMLTENFQIRTNFEKCFEKSGLLPKIKVSSNDTSSIKNLAYRNNLLSLDIQHNIKKEHSFRHVPFPCSDLCYELFLVNQKDSCSDAVEKMCQYIKNQMNPSSLSNEHTRS